MKFNPRIQFALAVIATVLLTSCGGGGAKNNPNQGGTLSLLPSNPTFFAGVAYTMTISGGRAPYSLTSDQPQVMSVPATVNGNTFQVVPNNPGVIDTGLSAGELPVRTVNLTVKDSAGQGPIGAAVKVGQNFLTGYTLTFPTTTCKLATGSTTITPCAGGDTVAEVSATIAGNLVGDALFQFDVVTGTMGFVNPIGSNTVTQSFQATSDHQGNVFAIVRVPAGTPTQIGMIRVTHVASGVSANYTFVINGNTGGALTAVPSSFTFTGSLTTDCGTGSGDFFVTGGVPPYHAVSSSPNVTVVADDNGASRFTVTAGNAAVCGTSTIIVTDSGNTNPTNSTQVTVTTAPGTTAVVKPTAVTAAPSTLTLACGATGSVTAVGGTGSYSATSSAPAYITTAVSGNTVSITRIGDDTTPPPARPPLATGAQSVNITDGASVATVTVNVPTACP